MRQHRRLFAAALAAAWLGGALGLAGGAPVKPRATPPAAAPSGDVVLWYSHALTVSADGQPVHPAGVGGDEIRFETQPGKTYTMIPVLKTNEIQGARRGENAL